MKILMVVLQFPPMGGMAVSRSYTFAKYWSKLGHKVTIVTPKKYSHLGALDFDPKDIYIKEADVIEVDYAKWITKYFKSKNESPKVKQNKKSKLVKLQMFVRKIRHSFLGNSFDINFLWQKEVYKKSVKLLNEDSYDMLFTSFTPQASFIVGNRLKKRFPELFWVADYRDLWTENHILKMHPIIKYFQIKKERRILKDANLITTTSNAFAQSLKLFHNKNVEVITNGYEEEAFLKLNKEPFFVSDSYLRFVHVGTIYEGVRDPTPFFEALKRLVDENIKGSKKIRVIFYGENSGLQKLIDRYQLSIYVSDGGYLSKEDALRVQRDCDALLLLDFVEEGSLSSQGMVPAKVYEYLYVQKPIFALGVTEEFFTGELIKSSGLGRAYGVNSSAIYNDLKLFLENKLSINPNSEIIASYSREKKAKELLDKVEKYREIL